MRKGEGMSTKSVTPFEVRCEILSDLWIGYREEPDFKDFTQYNDVGLPAAFLVAEGLADTTEKLSLMINETFELLLGALEIKEDIGFDDIDDLLVG
jgi:hypothetical protein